MLSGASTTSCAAPRGSLAAFVDLRLPTGDEANLLGSGATQTKLSLVAGGGTGRFSPRASLGYTLLERRAATSRATCPTRSTTRPASTSWPIRG